MWKKQLDLLKIAICDISLSIEDIQMIFGSKSRAFQELQFKKNELSKSTIKKVTVNKVSIKNLAS